MFSNDANEATKKGQKNTEAWVLYHLGKFAEAIKYYEKALKIDPKNTEALVGIGNVKRARTREPVKRAV